MSSELEEGLLTGFLLLTCSVPKFIDTVFAKTSPTRSFSAIEIELTSLGYHPFFSSPQHVNVQLCAQDADDENSRVKKTIEPSADATNGQLIQQEAGKNGAK